jgi:hypothetical protein
METMDPVRTSTLPSAREGSKQLCVAALPNKKTRRSMPQPNVDVASNKRRLQTMVRRCLAKQKDTTQYASAESYCVNNAETLGGGGRAMEKTMLVVNIIIE